MPFDVQGALNAGYTPAQVADEVGRAAGFDTAAARQHGYTDQQIIAELATRESPHGGSWIGDIQGGLRDLGTAASTGAKAIGVGLNSLGLPGQETANGVAGSIENITPSEPAQSPGSPVADLKAGQYKQALVDTAHHALRGAVGSAPIFAGEALGGPVGAAIGAGAEALGPTAAARAQANNRPMTAADVAAAIPGAAAQGLAGAMIPGSGLPAKLASPLARAGARAAMASGGVGGMALTGQVANTLGTEKGLTVNPEEIGNAALTGGLMGGTMGGAELARSGVKNAADNVMASRLEKPASPEDAASVIRVNNLMDQAKATASNASGRPVDGATAANVVKRNLAGKLVGAAADLRAADQISQSDFNSLRTAITRQAEVHNNTITSDTFDQINDLDIDPQAKQFLSEGIRDLNTVSGQSFRNNETGPFRMVGNAVGRAVPIAGALLSHNPALIVPALLGHRVEGKIGGAIGGGIDRLIGTNTPPVVLQRINAMKALQAAGIDPRTVGASPGMPQLPQAPGKAGPVPGFIRPMGGAQVMNPPAPEPAPAGPVPPFIRPRPQMPVPQPGQPDPTTGLPPSPIPPNVPLKPNGPIQPTGGAGLPAFKPDNAQTVASVLAADKMAEQAAPAALQGGAAPAAPPVPPTAPQASPAALSGAMAYLKNGLPGMTPGQITQALQAHEDAGRLSPGTVADLQAAPKVPPAIGAKLQQLAAMSQVKAHPMFAVDRSEQARVNAREYQNNARAYAAMHPDVADEVLKIAQGAKTPEDKQAMADAYVAQHPQAAGKFPDWLLNHGRKS